MSPHVYSSPSELVSSSSSSSSRIFFVIFFLSPVGAVGRDTDFHLTLLRLKSSYATIYDLYFNIVIVIIVADALTAGNNDNTYFNTVIIIIVADAPTAGNNADEAAFPTATASMTTLVYSLSSSSPSELSNNYMTSSDNNYGSFGRVTTTTPSHIIDHGSLSYLTLQILLYNQQYVYDDGNNDVTIKIIVAVAVAAAIDID
eukprot:CAMPEP_0170923644 /NCGR_PEP_ID=MMETSP0735-20130129/11164_1 /TAXON_ID=186038 /ORGANISM="Fragilariopsis kerguelensis, Strain L26-C5" /LENGTH=200 /DNA_ID=CAMNT_0011323279 /DNA_START=1339 /DNA_END=1938 /DNA_ORIENTATION=+